MPFHRVIAGFMAQTGDGQSGNGTGGSKYPEPAGRVHEQALSSAASSERRGRRAPIRQQPVLHLLAENPGLNNKYTVVGEVVSGMDVVDKIKKGPEAQNGAVANPDKITHMQVAADAK